MRFQDVRFKGLGTGLLGAGLLGLLLGTCGVMTAQDGHDEAKPQQQEEPKQDEAKPPRQQNEPREAKPSQEQPKAQEAKPSNNQKQDEKQNGEMRSGKEQDHAAQNNGAARASEQRGQRIPDDKFRSNFGRQHTFRVRTQVVEGQPRFQYSGYWFALATPWPGDWDYADDCYVDYIDGEYVLIDLRHPGVQLALIVVE